jgi:hypothetical protein
LARLYLPFDGPARPPLRHPQIVEVARQPQRGVSPLVIIKLFIDPDAVAGQPGRP